MIELLIHAYSNINPYYETGPQFVELDMDPIDCSKDN